MPIKFSDFQTGKKESRHLLPGEYVYPVHVDQTKCFYPHRDGHENSGYSANLQRFTVYKVVRNLKMSVTLIDVTKPDISENWLRVQKTEWHTSEQVIWYTLNKQMIDNWLKEKRQ